MMIAPRASPNKNPSALSRAPKALSLTRLVTLRVRPDKVANVMTKIVTLAARSAASSIGAVRAS